MFVSNPNLTNYFDKIINSNLDPYSSKCDLVIVQLRALLPKTTPSQSNKLLQHDIHNKLVV